MRLATGLHPVEQQATGLAVGLLVQVVDRLAQALAQHVGVPHLAEQAAEPAQLVDQRRQGLLVEERPERAQVAAQPPGGHPGLVHALVAGVQPDDGVVEQEPPHGRGDGVLERGPDRGVLVHGRDVRVARRQRTRSERPGQLGHVVRLTRAGRPQHVDHRVDHVGRRALRRPRPRSPGTANRPRRRRRPTRRRRSARRAAGRPDPGWRRRCGWSGGARPRPGRRPAARPGPRTARWSGGVPRRAVHLDLQPVELDALARHRHLQRPPAVRAPLPGPVAERDPHAQQPQVARVEEAGVEHLLLGLRGDHPGHGRRAGPAPGTRARPRPSPPARGGPRRSRTAVTAG